MRRIKSVAIRQDFLEYQEVEREHARKPILQKPRMPDSISRKLFTDSSETAGLSMVFLSTQKGLTRSLLNIDTFENPDVRRLAVVDFVFYATIVGCCI